MAEGLIDKGTFDKIGCMDPMATNFDPLATSPCAGCCTYQPAVTGCMDPIASNYNPSATVACNGCCDYGGGIGEAPETFQPDFNPGGFTPDTNDTKPDDNPLGPELDPNDPCANLVLAIQIDGTVIDGNGNPIPESCCTKGVVGNTVIWDGSSKTGKCKIHFPTEETQPQGLCEAAEAGQISDLPSRVTCIDCDNFTWWNNLYTSTHGSSLQNINQPLWDYLVSVVENAPPTNNGGSFYVDNLTGNIITSEGCCDLLAPESTFIDTTDDNGNIIEVCLCDIIPQETPLSCKCITTIEDYVQIASSKAGAIAILNTDTLVSIGLSLEDANFIITNLYVDNTIVQVQARTLLANALYVSGGFYTCFEIDPKENITLLHKAVAVTETKCTELNGYWTGTGCLCNYRPDCDLTIMDVQVTHEQDGLGNDIDVVTIDGVTIDEDCCNSISSDNNLGWVYTTGVDGVSRCYHTPPAECNPIQFKLNETPIEAECPTPIEVTAWLYFGRPEDPCQPYPPEEDDEVIIPGDDDPCILEFDENNNLVEATDVHVKRTQAPPMESLPGFEDGEGPDGTNPPDNPTPTPVNPTEPCCYNQNIPIKARLIVITETEEIQTPIVEFDSGIDGFDTWVQLSTELIPSDTLGQFDVKLEFYQGLNCCCTYDIYLDGLKVSCREDEVVVETLVEDCPGFEIQHVIDNKKSWVYNPGKGGYSDIPDDSIIVQNGDFGLIGGFGTINRQFAPSPDADLPWRYTDYFKQSSTLERHSNLVINSKELFLTFDMCATGEPCPDGYVLSGGTNICYKPCNLTTTEYSFSPSCQKCVSCNLDYSYIDCFGDTVYGSLLLGESTTICAVTDSLTIITATTTCDWAVPITVLGPCSGNTTFIDADPFACRSKINLLQLESYKKVFQSFWVQFVEQFVPATTIFVSGERWCNRPEDICAIYDECDFDWEFVEGDVTTTPNEGGFDFQPTSSDNSKSYDPETDDPTDQPPIDPTELESTEGGKPIDTENVKIRPLDGDLGLNSEEPSVITDLGDKEQNAKEYYDKLNNEPVETITQ